MLRALQPDPNPSDRDASSRRVRTAALLGSLLIHLALGLVFLHFSKPLAPKLPPQTASIELEVQAPEPAPAAPETRATPERIKVKTPRPRVLTEGGAPKRVANGLAGAESGDVPHRLDLALHGPIETASPGGKTVRNLPGESGGEDVHPSLAQARITAWIDDDTATRRVDKGLVDDWFARLHRSLDRALNKAPAPAGLAVSGSLLSTYAANAAQYGATGTPGEPSGRGNPSAPSFDHQGSLGAALGAPGTFRLQLDSSSRDPWAVVELSYDLGGRLRGSKVLESSGNRLFNLHVLNVVALGLPGLPDLPDGGEGIHADGTRSVWRIRGHFSLQHDLKSLSANDIWYLPLATAVGIASGVNLDDIVGHVTGKPQLQCEVELLQVY